MNLLEIQWMIVIGCGGLLLGLAVEHFIINFLLDRKEREVRTREFAD